MEILGIVALALVYVFYCYVVWLIGDSIVESIQELGRLTGRPGEPKDGSPEVKRGAS